MEVLVQLFLYVLSLTGAAVALQELIRKWKAPRCSAGTRGQPQGQEKGRWCYDSIKQILETCDISLPWVLVDIKTFDKNCLALAKKAETYGKTIRIATKSLRVPYLISRALKLSPTFQGLMCFSAEEAAILSAYLQGEEVECRDFLVAYPTLEPSHFVAASQVMQNGDTIILMVDCIEHIQRLDDWWRSNHPLVLQKLPVCIDLDMSWRPLPGVHLGAHRSPCRTVADVAALADAIEASSCLVLAGVMGYEAQISGVPDTSPCTRMLNPIVRVIKRLSFRDVLKRRQAVRSYLESRDVDLRLFNAGGTGSLLLSASDPSATEVTAGSGLLQSQLFDWFAANENNPAFAIALRCTRSCDPGIICCQSGGFIASGQVSEDKAPQPFIPRSVRPFPNEGYGEVQTPLQLGGTARDITVGDPVLVRPAKAGEIAERFKFYLLLDDAARPRHMAAVPTYRGMGHCFH